MREILPSVDVVIGNEEDACDIFGIKAGQSNIGAGKLDIDRYPEVAASIIEQFPNTSKVAITLRESVSATHNNWSAMLYDKKTHKPYFAPLNDGQYKPYEICNIVDRVGGGDSFAAGLLFGFWPSLSPLLSKIPPAPEKPKAETSQYLHHHRYGQESRVAKSHS